MNLFQSLLLNSDIEIEICRGVQLPELYIPPQYKEVNVSIVKLGVFQVWIFSR